MTQDGFGLFLRGFGLAASIVLLALIAYTMLRLFKRMSLGQRFIAVGVFFLEFYLLDVQWEFLQDDLGWRWRLVLLVLGQLFLLGYFFEPISARKRHGDEFLAAQGRADEIKP